jgi:hypothetical protein
MLMPWYGRNLVYGGDPVWPLGYQIFGSRYFSEGAYDKFASLQAGLGRSALDFVLGPWNLTTRTSNFAVTGDFREVFSPVFLVIIPLSALAWCRWPTRQRQIVALMLIAAFVNYVAWFAAGYQKLGLLFPVFVPLSIVVGFVVSTLWSDIRSVRITILGTVVIALGVHMGYSALQTSPFLPVVFGAVSTEKFLGDKVSYYEDLQWANANLPARACILSIDLHPYYFDRTYLQGAYAYSGLIEYSSLKHSEELLAGMSGLGITHVAVPKLSLSESFRKATIQLWPETRLGELIEELEALGNIREIYHNPRARVITSRTFAWEWTSDYYIYEVDYGDGPAADSRCAFG